MTALRLHVALLRSVVALLTVLFDSLLGHDAVAP